MFFVNVKDLCIDKKYTYDTITLHRDMPQNLGDMMAKDVMNDFSAMFSEYMGETTTVFPTDFVLNLGGEGEVATDEEVEDFSGLVNLVTAAFFGALVIDKGRPREYRLGIPKKMVAVKVNMSLLKTAINLATHYDVFNLHIYYKDLMFVLCDEKELPMDGKESEDDSTLSSN